MIKYMQHIQSLVCTQDHKSNSVNIVSSWEVIPISQSTSCSLQGGGTDVDCALKDFHENR